MFLAEWAAFLGSRACAAPSVLVATQRIDSAMKYAAGRPYAEPEAAARKLVEIAASIEPVQDGRIHIEKINAPFMYQHHGSGPEFGAGIKMAVERGWLELHESGTYVRLLNRCEII